MKKELIEFANERVLIIEGILLKRCLTMCLDNFEYTATEYRAWKALIDLMEKETLTCDMILKDEFHRYTDARDSIDLGYIYADGYDGGIFSSELDYVLEKAKKFLLKFKD